MGLKVSLFWWWLLLDKRKRMGENVRVGSSEASRGFRSLCHAYLIKKGTCWRNLTGQKETTGQI